MATNHEPTSQSTASYHGVLAAVQPVAPLFISSMNCREVIGQTWRWTRALAKQLGVPMITPEGSSKTLIPAHELVAALERAGKLREAEAPAAPAPGSADELAAMRAKLSMRRVGGVR